MIQFILEKQEALAEICRQHRVRRLDLFGSGLREADFDSLQSDVDLYVEFLPVEAGHRADSYFGLLEDLQRLFKRPVDLVMSTAARNPFFRQAVEANRELLYAA